MANELTVRPTLRRAKFALVVCVAILAVAAWSWRQFAPQWPGWVMLIPIVLFVWPLMGWIDSARTRLAVKDGIVRFHTGFLSQTTRSLELRKIQDVRVERSVGQRLWGIGTLVLETAGESGCIAIEDIDRPQEVADWILNASREQGTGAASV